MPWNMHEWVAVTVYVTCSFKITKINQNFTLFLQKDLNLFLSSFLSPNIFDFFCFHFLWRLYLCLRGKRIYHYIVRTYFCIYLLTHTYLILLRLVTDWGNPLPGTLRASSVSVCSARLGPAQARHVGTRKFPGESGVRRKPPSHCTGTDYG